MQAQGEGGESAYLNLLDPRSTSRGTVTIMYHSPDSSVLSPIAAP